MVSFNKVDFRALFQSFKNVIWGAAPPNEKGAYFIPASGESGVIFRAWPYTSEFSLAFEVKILFWSAQIFSFLYTSIFY